MAEILTQQEVMHVRRKFVTEKQANTIIDILKIRLGSKQIGLKPTDLKVLEALGIRTVADLLRKDDEFLVDRINDTRLERIGNALHAYNSDLIWGLLNMVPQKTGL